MTPPRCRVGVFDSGFGGLTVLRALMRVLPEAEFLYLGDTARLPYGSKSRETVARYAVSSSRFLIEQGAEFMVVACNTASALALGEIDGYCRQAGVPVMGVINAGIQAARRTSVTGDIVVIGTEATVGSHAYSQSGEQQGLRVLEKACPLLVPLVEEGWIEHPVTREVVTIYLRELFDEAARNRLKPDALVLGCTHYPLLRSVIEASVPAGVQVVDSAEVTAQQVARELASCGPGGDKTSGKRPRFFATDSVEKFERLGSRFLTTSIDKVELVDLECRP